MIFLNREEIIESHEGENYRLAAAGLPALTRRARVGRRVAVTPDPVCLAQINEKKKRKKKEKGTWFLCFCLFSREDRGGGGGGRI